LGGCDQLAELDAVAAKHRNAVLAVHPSGGHRRHQSHGPVPQLPVVDAAVTVAVGDDVWEADRVVGNDVA
jgi:hypothetical protein